MDKRLALDKSITLQKGIKPPSEVSFLYTNFAGCSIGSFGEMVEMEMDERTLLLVLSELRELNRLQSENKKSVAHMTERITHLQEVFDSIENKGYANRTLIREINSNLLRLSILSNPETANMFRRRTDRIDGYQADYGGSLATNTVAEPRGKWRL